MSRLPRPWGGAEKLRPGTRVRIGKDAFRHYLVGFEGVVTQVLDHAVIVALENDPFRQQKVIGTAGAVGPKRPPLAQRKFQFHEVEKID